MRGPDASGPALRRGIVACGAAGMVLLAVSAPWLASRCPATALAIHAFFSGVCHQDPARSFAIGGSHAAVCARCLGIYGGVAIGAMLGGRLCASAGFALRFFLGGLLLNGVDAAAEALRFHGNLPLSRLLLGALLGTGIGVLLTDARTDRISRRRDDSPKRRPQAAA